ncbi:hypothetical protein Q0590_33755 [Rhodocytophaga aerolata]|uniref:Uncharacterized protein n=1 Tax=Rhodocytophaga aerolata TaxID=455078 RepID=A0ABT8RGQ6_9BACT|nr:hypothetical protein [Rhodocytophaga aerolata]MDO1451289.1 hypothetical protein [Rhodocytophaga aerolata]
MQEVKVLEAKLPFRAESVTDPLVIGDMNRLIFGFWATAPHTDGVWHPCGWALFYTKHCLQYKYGYPNDEASPMHPLTKYGFDGYNISQVKYSDWIRQLEIQNQQKWPATDFLNRYEHWIFPFKETTLEVIAEKLQWRLMSKEIAYKDIQQEMIDWINNES